MLLGVLLVADHAAADCIDYGDYLHWEGSVDTPGLAHGVAVSGSYAYVADFMDGLQVIYIAVPGKPRIVGHEVTGDGPRTWQSRGITPAIAGVHGPADNTTSRIPPNLDHLASVAHTPGDASSGRRSRISCLHNEWFSWA